MITPMNTVFRSTHFSTKALVFGLFLGFGTGCVSQSQVSSSDDGVLPTHPFASRVIPPSGVPRSELPPPIQISGIGGCATGSADPVVIDSRTFRPQVAQHGLWRGEEIRPGSILPKHSRDKTLKAGAVNELECGRLTEVPRIDPKSVALFPGIGATPWTPPDPTIAVGPNHIVETVNMEIAWYLKDGTLQFQQRLDSSGDPGFLEDIGAGAFTFDPKCFYDALRERFVVLALEHYDGESWITLAISDDDDPNGVWFKYRTEALIEIDETTYWVDYPGFGFDDTAWCTTNNLFKEEGEGPGFAGTLVRSYDPTGALDGQPITWTDTLTSSGSHQVAQVLDYDDPALLVRSGSSTSIDLVHVADPLGTPQLITRSVAVPEYSSANERPPTPGGANLNPIDRRVLNVMIRNGTLWVGHSVSTPEDSRTTARWYEIDLDGWPEAELGEPLLLQAGEIRPNSDTHTFFPAIAVNGEGRAAVVYSRSSSTEFPTLEVAGRFPGDAPGTLGAPLTLAVSDAVPGSPGDVYRWGDYFDATMDPLDDQLFWFIGELYGPNGWQTEIGSFRVALVGDINGDGLIDGQDLAKLLSDWGTDDPDSDLDGSGTVAGGDLSLLLSNWS